MLLKEIKLQTKNLPAIYEFYSDVLELPVIRQGDRNIAITAGKTSLNFESITDDDPFYHFAFNIPSNKIEEATDWLKPKVDLLWIEEYKSHIAAFDTWHARSVYFTDPAGNILEFIARFDLNDKPGEPFSSAHVRNISEIGIVFPVDEYEKQVNKLLELHQIKYFSKQPPMAHFRAMGDDEGLLIVVSSQRNWYPTNIPCRIFPLSVSFINDGKEHRLEL